MAKDEIDRASRAGVEEVAVGSKQHDAAELLKKMKVVADADDKAAAETAQADAPAPEASVPTEAQMVASADSIFASDAAPTMVAQAGTTATDAGGSGGISTGTLLAIGGVALVGGGIAIAANNDGGGHHHDDEETPPPPAVTAVAASAAEVNEGQSVTFTITGTPGATFAYTVSGAETLSGSVTIGADGKGYVTVPTTEDHLTEGDQTLTLTVGGQTGSVTVHDTSTTPPPAFTTGEDHIVGTAGDDHFVAPLVESNGGFQLETFQNGDTVDGDDGFDTLSISLLGGGAALTVASTNVEAVDITLTSAGGRVLYLDDYVSDVSIKGVDPINSNAAYLFAQGAESVTLTNINYAYLNDLTTEEFNLDIVNTRTTNGNPVNFTEVHLDSLFGNSAAQTLNVSISSSESIINATQLNSAYTEVLNLNVTGGHDSFYNFVDINTGGYLTDVVVTGDSDVALDFNEGIVTFDASQLDGGVYTYLYSDFDGDALLSLVNGGQGDDYIGVDYLADGATVNLGAGDDLLYVYDATGDATITAGDGDDAAYVYVAEGDITINLGAGDDASAVGTALGELTIDGGAGDDALYLYDFTSGKQVTLIGGDGNDFVDVSVAAYSGADTDLLVSIELGAGDDVLDARVGTNLLDLLTHANYDYATHVFTANVSADGGAGTADELIINASDAVDISARDVESAGLPDGIFNSSVSGFEILNVGDISGLTAGDVIDLDTLDGISHVKLNQGVAGTGVTIDRLANNGTIEFTAAGTATDVLNVNVIDATIVSHTTDVLNIIATDDLTANGTYLAPAPGVADLIGGVYFGNLGTVNAAGIETFNITTSDLSGDGGFFVLTLNGDPLQEVTHTITVTGDAGLYLSPVSNVSESVTLFDASGVTAGSVVFLSQNDSAAVTLLGGAGNDILFAAGTGNFADTLNGGAGDDLLLSNGGFDKLTGGTGADIFAFGPNANGNTYATITDFKVSDGDSIEVTAALLQGLAGAATDNTSIVFHQDAITLGSNAAFADYLNAAAGVDSTDDGAADVSWFVYNGNTYIVVDNNNSAIGGTAADTFQNSVTSGDQVIELTGVVDLSGYAAATGINGDVTAIVHP